MKGKRGNDFEEAVSLVNGEGKKLENLQILEENDHQQVETIFTYQQAVGYDGDGDLDLFVGCFGNHFYLHENNLASASTSEEKSVADDGNAISASPVRLIVSSPLQHAAPPHLVDWDRDGDLDLLTVTSNGGVWISVNEGPRQSPVWCMFKQLVPPSNGQEHLEGSARTRESAYS